MRLRRGVIRALRGARGWLREAGRRGGGTRHGRRDGRGSKVSEDMVVPVVAFRLRVGESENNSRGASTVEENVDIERRRR
jgi:hypothetical protein